MSEITLLTPNQKTRIIKAERERRRVVRLIQVRRQSNVFASELRERIRTSCDKELQCIRRELTDLIVRRQRLQSPRVSSPCPRTDMVQKRKAVSGEHNKLAIRRHREAINKLKSETEARNATVRSQLERRKKAVKQANARSRRLIASKPRIDNEGQTV
ncbi:hypothetical protein AB6A40_009857 [Gnathostoma spinigerum]|uniref:Uncharacterized protein n=1 Tax=Gnathostoma spinigerum TaxID=75299 RepID=A0ABD6ETJ9_9BILA